MALKGQLFVLIGVWCTVTHGDSTMQCAHVLSTCSTRGLSPQKKQIGDSYGCREAKNVMVSLRDSPNFNVQRAKSLISQFMTISRSFINNLKLKFVSVRGAWPML